MQGRTYRGSCNLWRSVSCLNSNPQLVKETLVSWETIKDLSSNWLDLARHWRECHDGFQPNILDNLLPNWTRPSIRSRCRSIEFLLASQNVFLPRKQARDTKILISPDGAWEKAHLDAGDTPLADTPHPARVEWLEEHLFLASFNREKFCLTWMDSSVNWSSITSQNPAHTTPLLHLFNSQSSKVQFSHHRSHLHTNRLSAARWWCKMGLVLSLGLTNHSIVLYFLHLF